MSCRHLPVTKFMANGKRRRYKNLATFNKECGKRSARGNICVLTNTRKLKSGEGCLATVRSIGTSDTSKKSRYGGHPTGLWRLHFASCGVMRDHLKGRVDVGAGASLDNLSGKRKRRR